jgi:phosphonate transport system substrate-binding protein
MVDSRRLLIPVLCLMLALGSSPAMAREQVPTLRIGLTPVFLDNKLSILRIWQSYLENRLQRRVEFVQRQTYREITDLLLGGDIQSAWICGFPFVRFVSQLTLLAVPLYRGQPLYQSYLIVPATDESTRDIADLRDKIFAYSDPDSNSGYLVPRVGLRRMGYDPDTFFARTFFAWAHYDVVMAVAEGVAQGGAVDGYVWDTLRQLHPEITQRTRIVTKSRKFGFPPLVVSNTLPDEDVRLLRHVMLRMKDEPDGVVLLRELNLDGFVSAKPELYEGIRENMLFMNQAELNVWQNQLTVQDTN